MNPILLEAKKYFKYSKMLLNELVVIGLAGNAAFPVDILKNHKNKMSNYKKTVEKMDSNLTADAILKYVFCKNIVAFYRMMESGTFADDKDHVTVASISSGIDLNSDREYMIFPDINISLTYIWCTAEKEVLENIAKFYDHMFFHAIEFVNLIGGIEHFTDVSIGYLQHDSKIRGACEMARYVIDNAVDNCVDVEDKSGAKNASKILFQSLSDGAVNAGIKSPEELSPDQMMVKPELVNAFKAMSKDLQTKVENKELTKSQMLDTTYGICDIGEKEYDNMPPEVQKQMKTFAVFLKGKLNSPDIKNNPHATKFCNIFISRFINKGAETDMDLLKKLRRKKGMDVVKELM